MKSSDMQLPMDPLLEMVTDVFDAEVLRNFHVVARHEVHIVLVGKTKTPQD
jgi:hypothetical protein